ncbi:MULTISPECIES: hypothetical protein [Enterococcus]|uniref:hypothetical protein n=1 Tax=Enterococcus TaxID=1350 RepID=UPI000F511F70|nr:hypothetical protein [Enterococcus hirae]EMF0180372.1 hypothetical protein [Enterococcus hirae]EMF0196031.1 hypothetical protein [Enterococcus hirae]MCH1650301.1 hypothetical protein [Enterococcus hirae]MCL4588912.1 hypothetical protein [Enterococcus hirae]MCV3094991.1 hypothetical protein [Enterococcus hirae]
MSNLEHQEEKTLDKIIATVNKLDKELDELDTLSENPEKKHNLKKWLVERKAIHEIKKILHEAGKYEKYDEKELDKEFKEINDLLQ